MVFIHITSFSDHGIDWPEVEEMTSFVNPYDLLMMRQDARRDVLEAMFQNVVRSLVLNNDGEAVGLPSSTPLLQADIDRLPTSGVETLTGRFNILFFPLI